MLSVIIVNYNVKYFLEQCLHSLRKAIAGMEAEIIVVDNNSADQSVEYLQPKFPEVIFVTNNYNLGYAKANNQGWHMAKGDYILFLNPDTILSEDCISKSVQALRQDKRRGALGVRMIDGSGAFLPESKRGFPSLAASFYKLSGLIKLFPHSSIIARYYLGHLSANKSQEVDVLCGAYMMLKREVLEKTGAFDEAFFMYGEDIDLSYRIQQAGYTNYYLADSSIIHFKGESADNSMAHTKMFYNAMRIFVKKHYRSRSGVFSLFIQLAIAVRGVISFFGRLLRGNRHETGHSISSIIAGNPSEVSVLQQILENTGRKLRFADDLEKVYSILQTQGADEIIFCANGLQYKDIIDTVEKLNEQSTYKFTAKNSRSIVGSTVKKKTGEVIAL